MDNGTVSIVVAGFGFLGAVVTVGLPLLIRRNFDLASKREDEQKKLARDFQIASEFANRIYDIYVADRLRIKAAESDLARKRTNPDSPLPRWEYIISDIATQPIVENELRQHLEMQSYLTGLKRRKGEDKDEKTD